MPYDITKRGGKECVTHGDKTFGCHDTKAEARQQQKAIYANTHEGGGKGKGRKGGIRDMLMKQHKGS